MKKAFIISCLILPLFAHAQEKFSRLKRQGDSLVYKHNLKDALIVYDKAVNLVLSGKEKAFDSEWFDVLNAAGIIVKGHNKYWNLAFGTKAEKLPEKITTLKEMGVKNLLTYKVFQNTDVAAWPADSNSCYSKSGQILVWAINNNVFMQAFDDCTTYKPVNLHDNVLYDLLNNHYEAIMNKNFRELGFMSSAETRYKFTFYSDNNIFVKEWCGISYFTDPKSNRTADYIAKHKNSIDSQTIIYNYNMSIYFSKLFLRIFEDDKIYNEKINSSAEKGLVGKLEQN
ncbi:hypothetical protein FO440_11930 [Mucilaginibacter corticis]|uniref:Tetratricopeptide repeat protein n=1 Tax=Mucilaginibacter corticis TaxID=2597670 RepID=A0A556MKR5_9SPHI|nr:hypothetical protein [Mucilaginibacter corticis]TSJ40458.1 hypothetical protein FO440_11930 [Mucilaginibacter corticis]